MFLLLRVVPLLLLLVGSKSIDVNASSCNQSSYYNYIKFACTACNTTSQYKSTSTFCNCSVGYYDNENVIGFQSANSCLNLAGATSQTIMPLHNNDGSSGTAALNCTSSTAYPNKQRTKCISCPIGMIVNTTTMSDCYCSLGNNVNGKCVSLSNNSNSAISVLGCINQSNPDPQYCQLLLDLCVESGYTQSGTDCSLINSNNLGSRTTFPTYQISTSELYLDELGITVSTQEFTNTTSLKNKLPFYIAQFDSSGQFLDLRPLRNELFNCSLSQGDSITLQSFGTGFYRECTIIITPSYQYFYDLYIKSSTGLYAQVPIEYVNQNTTFRKRFTQSTQSIKLNLTSVPPLITPIVTISILSNTATGQIYNESITETNYQLIGPFIALNVVVLAYFIYAMFLHVKYNPENLGENTYCFRMMWGALWLALRCWTVGLFVWLAGVSTFAFCFYKLQNALFMILPDPNDSAANLLYYTPFKTVFFIMFGLGLISVLQLIFRITNAQYFLLDWEKPKENPGKFSTQHNNKQIKPSIWRRLFVVNELYELALKRICSAQFTLLFSGLFLEGLKWSNLKYMIPNTTLDSTAHTVNPILGYFITTFLLVVISICQIFIRKLLKIWWPLPVEQFIDLCCLSNLSIFIFDQGIHGYYIHGMSPLGKSEGSLEYIESIFQKESESYGRNRGLLQQDDNQTQSYEVIAPRVMRFEFNKLYLERIQQILSAGVMANTFISKPIPQLKGQHYDNLEKLRQDMINNFRLYLEETKLNKNMQIKERNWLTRMFSCPPDAVLHEKLPVMYKDPDYMFSNVFLCGNQLYILINEINIFNLWYIVIGNTFHAIILTMVMKLLISFFTEYRMKRNISLNTFVDDKFFV